MTGRPGRTRATSPADARVLVQRAAALMLAVDLLVEDDGDPAAQSAAAAVAVIAGIAAADAICAVRLGRRARGQDHRSAVDLLREATPGQKALATALSELVDLKDQAHYGVTMVSRPEATRAARRARTLLDAARQALAR